MISPPTHTLVELSAGLPVALRNELVYGAYRGSHAAPVILWLRGVALEDVDPTLDTAVSRMGTGLSGVEFRVDASAREMALGVAGPVRCVLSTPEIVSYLDPHETTVLSVQQALAAMSVNDCFCAECFPVVERGPALAMA